MIDEKNQIFNEIAKDYRDIHTENVSFTGGTSEYYAEYKIEEISSFYSPNEKLKILDLGCGDGISAVFFEKYFPNSNYLGIDLSVESLNMARNRNLKNAVFVEYDGFNIPFETEEFDLIFIACVLHHVEHDKHQQLLTECNRVLSKNGSLIIFEHNQKNPFTRKVVRDCVFDEDAVLIPHKQLKKTLEKSMFNNVKTSFTLFMPRKYFFNYLLFLEKLFKKIPFGGQYYTIAKKNK